MAFFTADICDDHSDQAVSVLGPGLLATTAPSDKCQGEIVTQKLDHRNNSDLICPAAGTRTAPAKSWWSMWRRPTFAVVGENLMKFAHQQQLRRASSSTATYQRHLPDPEHIPVALYALGTCPRKSHPGHSAVSGASLCTFGGRASSSQWRLPLSPTPTASSPAPSKLV